MFLLHSSHLTAFVPRPSRFPASSIAEGSARRFYCGWAIVAVGLLAFFAALVSSIVVSLLVKPMSDYLGWNRSSAIDGLATPLKAGDEVSIVPAVAGGC